MPSWVPYTKHAANVSFSPIWTRDVERGGREAGEFQNVRDLHTLGSNEPPSSPASVFIRSPLSGYSPFPLGEEAGPYPRIQDPARLPLPCTVPLPGTTSGPSPDAEGLAWHGDRGILDSAMLRRPMTHRFSGDCACPWWPTLHGTLVKRTRKVPNLMQHPSRRGRQILNGFKHQKMPGRRGCWRGICKGEETVSWGLSNRELPDGFCSGDTGLKLECGSGQGTRRAGEWHSRPRK